MNNKLRLVASGLLAVVIALLVGCATSGDGNPQSDVARTWEKAERYVPEAKNPPVVVFLHGCTGITNDNRIWGRLLRDAGYLVIFPNSFARRGRSQYCDPQSFSGIGDLTNTYNRTEEAAYAAAQLQKSRPPKLILMGHSEGGYAVQYWTSPEHYDAAIVSGTSCRRVNLPIRFPTLLIRYESDPWDQAPHQCRYWALERPNTIAHIVPGGGHDAAMDRTTQRRVIEFLKGI